MITVVKDILQGLSKYKKGGLAGKMLNPLPLPYRHSALPKLYIHHFLSAAIGIIKPSFALTEPASHIKKDSYVISITKPLFPFLRSSKPTQGPSPLSAMWREKTRKEKGKKEEVKIE